MTIKLKVHPYLRSFTGNQKVVEVNGNTVGECIDNLDARFSGIKQRLVNKYGKMESYWEIYINSENCTAQDLSNPVKDGDELAIIAFVAGG